MHKPCLLCEPREIISHFGSWISWYKYKSNVLSAMGELRKWRILYHSLPRIAKSYITLMSLFSSCHSGWVGFAVSFRQPWTFLCTWCCTCVGASLCNAEQDTIWAHFKTHHSSPWAPGPCITVTTQWHNEMWKNRNLQIRCTGVNSSSHSCWHRRTQEEGWASEHRHQQNSKNMWRIALGLTSLNSHFMHWNAFQNYLTHLHHKTYACFPVWSERDPKPWA